MGLLITQHQIHVHCKALEGMNYLPAPWVPFIRETGPDWGSDINKLDLERPSQRTKDWRNGELWLGRYGIQAVLSLDLLSGRQLCKVTWIWISADSFLPLEKRASSFFFSLPASPALARSSQLFQAL